MRITAHTNITSQVRRNKRHQCKCNLHVSVISNFLYLMEERSDNLGGRIDNWDACLEDGARPEDMQISGSDALIVSPDVAYSTAIEFPPNAGIDSATLLAVQRWQKGDDWKLSLHQTIPWSPASKAGGTLLCSCKGCVAMTRKKDKRTRGGIVG